MKTTLERRIEILENKLMNEAMNDDLENAKDLWEELREMDSEAESALRTLIATLRSAADKLEARVTSDGSDEGWNIHSTDPDNLSEFISDMSKDIKEKIDTAAGLVDDACMKFDDFEEFMDSNNLDWDEL